VLRSPGVANKTRAKHRHIYEELFGAIQAGEYAVGEQIPTEAQLATRYGASRPTVARALRDLEQRGYLIRRRGVGSFVSERDHTRTKLFGLMLPRPGEGIFESMCDSIVRQAEAHGYAVLLAGSPLNRGDSLRCWAEAFCEQLISRSVTGMFFGPLDVLPDELPINVEIAEMLSQAAIPVVLLDRDVYDQPMRSRFDLVGVNNYRESARITNHLLDQGCRHIEYVSHQAIVSTATSRIAGYKDAMHRYGIDPEPGWIHRWDVGDRDYVRELVRGGHPDAYICINDLVAISLMHNLAVLGVRVPEDVRLVGFDDIDRARHLPVPLTTIRQPGEMIGTIAVKMMMDRIENPRLPAREVSLACDLIVRESCGAHTVAAEAADAAQV
jgi:GntR family transcriptional regulator of arabinose operon